MRGSVRERRPDTLARSARPALVVRSRAATVARGAERAVPAEANRERKSLDHSTHTFAGNPFCFLSHNTRLEDEVRAHILREHRLGRRLGEILSDAYLSRPGCRSVCRDVLDDPVTIRALTADVENTLRTSLPLRQIRTRPADRGRSANIHARSAAP